MTEPKLLDEEMPFFSIIIASLNNIDVLKQCINSLNEQSFTQYEVLVSDGGSIDGTRSFLDAVNIRNLTWSKSSSDSGIYSALNLALTKVRGQWILVLGSDDKLSDPDALRRASAAITESRQTQLFYSNLLIRGPAGLRLKTYPDFDEFCSRFSGAPFIHHQSAFVSRAAIDQFGLFDTSYTIHSDHDLMLRIICNTPAVKIDDVFVEYSSSGYSSKMKNIVKSFGEVQHIRRRHGHPRFNARVAMIYLRLLCRVVYNLCKSRVILKCKVRVKCE